MPDFVKLFGKGKETGTAEKLYKSFKPVDLMHVAYVLGLKVLKGWTPEIAMRVVKEHPELAKRIIARAVKK